MNKTKIEWCDYTVNPIKGLCPVDCKDNQGKSYCYARAMYKRFKWNPEIRYEDPFYQFYDLKKKPPSRVFVGSTMELFGDWIREEWMVNILSFCKAYPQHTFIFLTKQPQNLIKFSPFPSNVWLGVSATNQQQFDEAVKYLKEVEATVKFISFEPLLERINIDL